MTQEFLTELPDYGANVREFGACGDGTSDDAPAIQRALDSGQPLITVPYGVYRIGQTLCVNSHTRLLVHSRARLFLADHAGVDRHTHLLANRHPERGDSQIRIEGGIWDGNNPRNPRGPDAPDSYTGVLINFTNVEGLALRSLTLRDAETYFVRLGEVRDFEVDHVQFEAPHLRPNQDGVHLGGFCEDGVIRNLSGIGPGTTNDDMVALNADDANDRAQNLGKKCGPIRRVRVENLAAADCHTFVRLLSVSSPIEDVIVENVQGGCRVCALNMDACRECRVPLFDPHDPQYADGAGAVACVTVRDLHVSKSVGANPKPLLDLRTRARDLVVADVRRDGTHDANPTAPTLLIAGMQPCDVVIEGLQPHQAEALRASSTLFQERIHGMASANDQRRFRGVYQVERGGALLLASGGLGRLQVNNVERKAL